MPALVGTVAYQVYPAMLGLKLPGALLQTSDVDVAQSKSVSNTIGYGSATSYVAKAGVLVDFITPNEGPEKDAPQMLPSLRTYAQPLRFQDFLIRDPAPAVLLTSSCNPSRYGFDVRWRDCALRFKSRYCHVGWRGI